LRGACRRRPAVHRPRRSELAQLGDHALLGASERRPARRFADLGAGAWPVHRRAGRCVRADQLRVRRDRQPGAEAGQARPMIANATRPLLQVKDLSVDYLTDRGPVRAVDRVSLDVAKGEFLGIVGESGCGKSTLLFAIARLLSRPAEINSGEIWFGGHDMVSMDEDELRHLRW